MALDHVAIQLTTEKHPIDHRVNVISTSFEWRDLWDVRAHGVGLDGLDALIDRLQKFRISFSGALPANKASSSANRALTRALVELDIKPQEEAFRNAEAAPECTPKPMPQDETSPPESEKEERRECAPKGPGRMRGGVTLIAFPHEENADYYQLEHSGRRSGIRGGGYRVYRVDREGRFHACEGDEFPAPASSREIAEERFREWAVGRGYELKENVMTA